MFGILRIINKKHFFPDVQKMVFACGTLACLSKRICKNRSFFHVGALCRPHAKIKIQIIIKKLAPPSDPPAAARGSGRHGPGGGGSARHRWPSPPPAAGRAHRLPPSIVGRAAHRRPREKSERGAPLATEEWREEKEAREFSGKEVREMNG